ncbi:MAG: hypothetical protein PHD81_02140 [Candidatus Nanoarchaeia archaeon]|nr:hypothetical protein [Candidatus Nanoarchaeia archaeon]MDD5587890.1 hypothetical protein [Candidatus Nanoarchaeia archaeon]
MANDFRDIKEGVARNSDNPGISGMQPSMLPKEEIATQAMEEAPSAEPEIPEESSEEPMEDIPNTPLIPATSVPMTEQPRRDFQEQIEEITEAVVNEKWEELMTNVGNIAIWREKINTDIRSIKQEVIRIEERFGNLQNAVIGKIEDYHQTMTNVGAEMKALEKVLERIMQPLATNIRELNKITEDLKKKR